MADEKDPPKKRKPARTPKNKALDAPENKLVSPPENKAATERRDGGEADE
jgi:hypothetical protein